MKSNKQVDIFCIICPVSQKVKWVGAFSNNCLPTWLRKNDEYKSWVREIKAKKKQQDICILDVVPPEEVKFHCDYYQDLFRSWGFTLIENPLSQKNITESKKLTLYLTWIAKYQKSQVNHKSAAELSAYNEIPDVERRIERLAFNSSDLNDKLLLMELQLLICFTCYNGLGLSTLETLNWNSIRKTDEIYCQERRMFLPIDAHTINVCSTLSEVKADDTEQVFTSNLWPLTSFSFANIMNGIFSYFNSSIRIGPGSSDLNSIYGLLIFDRFGRADQMVHHLMDYYNAKSRSELICLLEYFYTAKLDLRPNSFNAHERLLIATN